MERSENHQPLLLESAAKKLSAWGREFRVPLTASMLFGLLAYMFAFTNKLVNHDDVWSLFIKGATLSSGRWGLKFLELIFPNYSMPWVYGIITLVFMSIAVCVIVRIFSIRSKLLQVLLAGSILVFPSLIGTIAYMFTCSSYAMSFLLAVSAVYFICLQSRKALLPALICMVGSLSIYQSYVAVAASLLVLVLIQRLLQEEDALSVVKSGVLYVGFLLVSLGIYYAVTAVLLRLRGSALSGYADGSLSFSLSSLPGNILLAYESFLRFFTEGYRGLMPTALSQALHGVLLLLTAFLLVLWAFRRKEKRLPGLLLLLVLIGILPLAVNCMYLISTADAVHTLVLYGFIAFYVLAAVLADHCIGLLPGSAFQNRCRQAGLNVLSFAMALIIAGNIYLANEAYLMLHLRYENAYSFYTSLVADIKMHPEFDENTRLAVIGVYREPEYYLEKFPFSDHITGTDGFLPDVYSNTRFLEYYLGFPIPFASEEETAQLRGSAEFEEMAVYPYYGSLKKIGDILVVKLS